jgi:hypothetical protein
MRWQGGKVGQAATIRRRTDRPCLVASTLLGKVARKSEGQGDWHPITDFESSLMGKGTAVDNVGHAFG